MTEPVLDYENSKGDEAWFAWLQAKGDHDLGSYWDFIKSWTPCKDSECQTDPDAMMMKYEMTAQEMDQRGL